MLLSTAAAAATATIHLGLEMEELPATQIETQRTNLLLHKTQMELMIIIKLQERKQPLPVLLVFIWTTSSGFLRNLATESLHLDVYLHIDHSNHCSCF